MMIRGRRAPHVLEELFVFLEELVGHQDHPKALADEVQELFLKEVRVCDGGLVGPLLHLLVEGAVRQGWGLQGNMCAPLL
jgi:hypothetical protein